MPTTTGQQVRMSRLIDPASGRGFCIAFDHALQFGICPGGAPAEAMLDMMAEAGVDGVILSLGTALRLGSRLARRGGPAMILRLDQTTMWRQGTPLAYRDGMTRLVAGVADAVALGADAVITYLFFGHCDPALETKSFEDCARVNAAARTAGMPHIIETMGARGGLATDVFAPELVAYHTRVGAEMGADIIKTDWPGSAAALASITASLPVPLLMAGGPRGESDLGTLRLVAEVMAGGAAGILFGRQIFDAARPLAVMKACRAIIHGGATVEEAMAGAGF
jgi:DhnA family fructose-bisphosphate aldolase class Ia